MIFVDTNVFVYAFSVDPKRAAARQILADGGLINAQVLNEFTSVMRTKARRSWEEIERSLSVILRTLPDRAPSDGRNARRRGPFGSRPHASRSTTP